MELRVGGKFRLGRKIGSGSFGDIYLSTNVQTGEEVAIKLESIKSKHPQLLYESKLYKAEMHKIEPPWTLTELIDEIAVDLARASPPTPVKEASAADRPSNRPPPELHSYTKCGGCGAVGNAFDLGAHLFAHEFRAALSGRNVDRHGIPEKLNELGMRRARRQAIFSLHQITEDVRLIGFKLLQRRLECLLLSSINITTTMNERFERGLSTGISVCFSILAALQLLQ